LRREAHLASSSIGACCIVQALLNRTGRRRLAWLFALARRPVAELAALSNVRVAVCA
jgi:hypothetical protein